MPLITRDSLLSLEAYARQRGEFRARVLAHKKNRILPVGEHVTLVFEDELTIRYQIQEMLRIERTFEETGILDELEAYNPLIPDGSNFKATMMIEYAEVEERRTWLPRLIGVEDRVWLQIDGQSQVGAIADEDLDRGNDEKTSAVHFLRFELTSAMKQALKAGAGLTVGIDHPSYTASVAAPEKLRASLLNDLV
jgi:hypothetical protein